jgi:ParB-like chromosome segregation protein Spo0J/DNA modification methylase
MTPNPNSIPLSSILVADRFRQDYGDVDELADSIAETGLIQPIVLSREGDSYRLVAGGRRYHALLDLQQRHATASGLDADLMLHHGTTCDPLRPGYIFSDEMSDEHRLEAELIENVQRKDYTWQERALNVAAVHHLKSQKNALLGKEWGYRQTGAMLNLAVAPVGTLMRLAKEIQRDPTSAVSTAATMTDAYKLLLQAQEDAAKAELSRRIMSTTKPAPKQVVAPLVVDGVEVPQEIGETAKADAVQIRLADIVKHASCLDFLDTLPDESFDHCITDTPYAIDMDMLDQQNPHGGMNDISRIAETHDVAENMELLAQLIPRLFRTLRPSGFFVTWCDIMQWQYLYDLGTRAGFKVQRWPVTWVKMHQCMNQSAQFNFTKNTEIAIVMRKPGATLVRPSSNCVVMAANSVAAKKLGHPFVKPFEVWEYLLRHIAMPGQTIFEPCAGVGSGVLSMLQLGFRVVATEIDEKHYNQLVINVSEHFKSVHPNCEFV